MIKISADILNSLLKKLDQQNIKYIGYFSEYETDTNHSFNDPKVKVYRVLINSEIGQFYTTTKDLDTENLIEVNGIRCNSYSAEIL